MEMDSRGVDAVAASMLIVMTTHVRLQASMLESTEAWRPQEWNMTTVDHYAVLPWGPHLYVGYASENKVKLYTRDMRVLEVGGDVPMWAYATMHMLHFPTCI